MQQLLAKYRLPSGLIDYASFCKNIDQVFSDEADPLAVIENSKSSSKFTEEEREIILTLLDAIRCEVKNKRILIKPKFQDYDRTKNCHVTTEQFRRVLKELKLIPPSEDLFQLLVRKYLDLSNVREVNYFSFCADIDRPEDIFPEYVPKKPKQEASWPLGQLRAAGSSYYKEATADLDVINNRFMQQRVEKSNNPSDIEDRLRACVVMKRVRIEEFFHDFDKLRKGKVTKNQFQQILSMLNFNLTQDEFDTLAASYKTADPEYLINYLDFCASINKAFTVSGIQKDPLAKVAPVTQDATIAARRKYLDFNDEEKQMLQGILNEYREAVRIKRIHLKPMFMDFDITKNQHVTKHQFLRTLAQLHVSTSEDVLNVLVKAYMDKGNVDEVNYYDFCEDVDSSDQLFKVGRGFNHSFEYYPKTRPRVTGADIKKDQPNDVDDILAKLRKTCQEQRIRISEFFRDFDKLRSGYITEAQFRIGLNMSKIVLSGAEFRLLADHFQAPKEGAHIKWREFSDCVDEIFTKKGLEQSVDIQLGDARTQSFYGKVEPSAHDHALCAAFQERFKCLVQRERLHARSFFQDQDRHNHFKVTPKQFRQTCKLLKCDLSEEELQALVNIYGNRQGDIQYKPFIEDTFVLKYNINEPYTGKKSTYVNTTTDFSGSRDVTELMQKVKDCVMRSRTRLTEFMQDHDPLRKGTIDATKFRTTLYAQKIQLTTEEYQKLEDYYRCPLDATKIRYCDFVEDIDAIFTAKDLEKDPTKTLSQYKAPSILDPKNVLSDEEEQELETCLRRIGVDVKHRRLLIKPFFQDKDKSHSGFVNNTRFRSIFDNQKLWITDREYYLINKRFQAKAANEINYVEFDHVMRHYSGDRE